MSKLVSRAVLVASAVGLVLTAVAQAAPVGMLKQFRTPADNSFPRYVAQGSDGNMWFTESPPGFEHFVARITPRGEITEFAVCASCLPNDIAQGPDDILYFTNNDVMLGRITTAGEVLPGVGPGLFVTGNHLAIGGGTVWITDFNQDVVWRYDIAAGVFTSVAPPTPGSDPGDIAVDADGVVWFTQSSPSPGAIASYDPAANVFIETPIPAGAGLPRSVAVAADGSVWYTRPVADTVGRLDPVTREITEFPVGAEDRPAEIAAAPDGSLWFTQDFAMNMARISQAGVVTTATKAIRDSVPLGIAVAADGDPWYVGNVNSTVVTLRLR